MKCPINERHIVLVLLVVAACAAALPAQVQNEADYERRYYPRALNQYNLGLPDTFFNGELKDDYLRQIRHGLDSLSGATFGESKRYGVHRKPPGTFGQNDRTDQPISIDFEKRNIDEIDRTDFDNFFKRNFDEIDRVGWSGFVKRRLGNAYPNGKKQYKDD